MPWSRPAARCASFRAYPTPRWRRSGSVASMCECTCRPSSVDAGPPEHEPDRLARRVGAPGHVPADRERPDHLPRSRCWPPQVAIDHVGSRRRRPSAPSSGRRVTPAAAAASCARSQASPSSRRSVAGTPKGPRRSAAPSGSRAGGVGLSRRRAAAAPATRRRRDLRPGGASRTSTAPAIGREERGDLQEPLRSRPSSPRRLVASSAMEVPSSPGVGLDGLEPSTSSLSGKRSNRAELQAPRAGAGPVGPA